MPEPLARREPRLPTVQQYPATAPAQQTEARLAQGLSVGLTVLKAKDHAFQEVEGMVNKGGRSYPHQKYFEGQAATTIHSLTVAYDEIYKREMLDIVNNKPRQPERDIVTYTRYEEVPTKKGLIGYLFG